MTDDTLSTLSREDALTLECEETDEEFALSVESEEPDTEDELEAEDESDDFWPTDDQVAAWELEDAAWRNVDAYWGGDSGYDAAREIMHEGSM